MEQAVLLTVHYRDLFSHALTLEQLHAYLIGCPAGLEAVRAAVGRLERRGGPLAVEEGRVMWRGREALVREAREREAISAQLRERARRAARWLRWLPYVRMAALTGSVAVGHAGRAHDLDLLCVAAPGRVWLAVGGLRLAHTLARGLHGLDLCANCVLDADELSVRHQNLYMAHQMVHVLPLWDGGTGVRFYAANPWVRQFLPNAPVASGGAGSGSAAAQRVLEALLPSKAAGLLERSLCRRGWRRALRFYGATHREDAIAEARRARRYMMPGLGYGPSVYHRFMRGHPGLEGRVTRADLEAAFGGDPATLAQVDPRLDLALSVRYEACHDRPADVPCHS